MGFPGNNLILLLKKTSSKLLVSCELTKKIHFFSQKVPSPMEKNHERENDDMTIEPFKQNDNHNLFLMIKKDNHRCYMRTIHTPFPSLICAILCKFKSFCAIIVIIALGYTVHILCSILLSWWQNWFISLSELYELDHEQRILNDNRFLVSLII